ncbi:MAG: hypothetical protein IPK13_14735 [Deltaproteobacteria bacterium]|nr:hypothetical protein [Deltaproteobacteria bacterium]
MRTPRFEPRAPAYRVPASGVLASAGILVLVAMLAGLGCESEALYRAEQPAAVVRDASTAEDAEAAPDGDAQFDVADVVDGGRVRDAGSDDASNALDDTAFEPAVAPSYAHTGSMLYRFDPATFRTTPVGGFRGVEGAIDDVIDIAIDTDGMMLGGTTEGKVYAIDPSSGFCRYRFTFDDKLNGLTFLEDGRLVVAGERVSLVAPDDGRLIFELVGGDVFQTSGDIIGLPDGFLYWTVRGRGGDVLVRIDPRTGAVSERGATGKSGIYGLGYAEGKLFGFSREGAILTIDAGNGHVTMERESGEAWWGATTNPARWR